MSVSFLFPLFLLSFASFAFSNAIPGDPKSALALHAVQDVNASSATPKIVYVSDFELDVVRRRTEKNSSAGTTPDTPSSEPSKNPPGTPSGSSGSAPAGSISKPSRSTASARAADSQAEDSPADRANALVAAMSENLVKILEKAGYSVHRLRKGEAPPQVGLRLRGVFAESDEQNRIRRLLVGGDSTSPKMLLYVCVDNLARPEQPLYELAKPPSNDSRHGPAITVTSFSPVARFEMDKSPSDDDLKKIATEITADLSALLNANSMGASQ